MSEQRGKILQTFSNALYFNSEWIPLRLTNSLFMVTNVLFYFLHAILCPERTIPLKNNCRSLIDMDVFFWLSIAWVGGGGYSKKVATFNHVGGSFNLFMATTRDVWIIPSFWIWDYVLHVEHVSRLITNCGQHQWVNPYPLSIALQALLEENTTRKLLSLSLDLFFKILLCQVAFSLYSFLSLSFLLTFFLLICYCSLWLYFSPGN